MNKRNNIPDLSYYRLSLMDFLRESHPERYSDERFINARSEAAAQTFAKAILNRGNDFHANHEALLELFEGLHFSRFDTLVSILWNEFSSKIREEDAKAIAMKLLPVCESIFSNYHLSDNFAFEPEYDLLYTELTGTIALYLENHGV